MPKKKKYTLYARQFPDFYIRRPIPWECKYCGEDRADMFTEKNGASYCNVCGAKAVKPSENE